MAAPFKRTSFRLPFDVLETDAADPTTAERETYARANAALTAKLDATLRKIKQSSAVQPHTATLFGRAVNDAKDFDRRKQALSATHSPESKDQLGATASDGAASPWDDPANTELQLWSRHPDWRSSIETDRPASAAINDDATSDAARDASTGPNPLWPTESIPEERAPAAARIPLVQLPDLTDPFDQGLLLVGARPEARPELEASVAAVQAANAELDRYLGDLQAIYDSYVQEDAKSAEFQFELLMTGQHGDWLEMKTGDLVGAIYHLEELAAGRDPFDDPGDRMRALGNEGGAAAVGLMVQGFGAASDMLNAPLDLNDWVLDSAANTLGVPNHLYNREGWRPEFPRFPPPQNPAETAVRYWLPLLAGLGAGIGGVTGGAAAVGSRAAQPAAITFLRQRSLAAENALADALKAEGRSVIMHRYYWTPLGARYPDLEVWYEGRRLGGIEVKLGSARYTPSQRAKDAWLRMFNNNYIVNVVRYP